MRIMQLIDSGDENSKDDLLPKVYDELRRLAKWRLSAEKPGQTLQPTALVHEAWLRLVNDESQKWDSRGHFFGAAAEAMRRILVEQARRKGRLKHGGHYQRADLSAAELSEPTRGEDLLILDEALGRLEKQHPNKARLIKLRYFAGMNLEESAQAMDISRATAARYWTFGRSWLFKEINATE
ncbi:MAG: ECF-type sigma factor [Pirellulaceae bacterium]|nr:ECF-type sigma factor [Pirellulaceae bacterium]